MDIKILRNKLIVSTILVRNIIEAEDKALKKTHAAAKINSLSDCGSSVDEGQKKHAFSEKRNRKNKNWSQINIQYCYSILETPVFQCFGWISFKMGK